MAKFSIIQAYKTAFATLWRHKMFYIFWGLLAGLINYALFLMAAVYVHLVQWHAIVQNPWGILFLFGSNGSMLQVIKQRTLYSIMAFAFPYSWLNHALEAMSWQEYYHIIVQPRMTSVVFLFFAQMLVNSMISTGYIKTALALQNGQSASLFDMISSVTLLPRLFFARLYRVVIIAAPAIVILLGAFLMPSLSVIWVVLAVCYGLYLLFMIKAAQVIYVVIDTAAGPHAAFRSSWAMMRGNVVRYVVFCTINPMGIFLRFSWFSVFLYKLNSMVQQQASVSVYRQLKP